VTTPCDGFVEAGGFSPEFTCEDIEFTFRVHNVGLLMNEQAGHSYPLRELIRLMLVGVADLFLYRPLLVAAHAKVHGRPRARQTIVGQVSAQRPSVVTRSLDAGTSIVRPA